MKEAGLSREKLNCAPVETEDSADTARTSETWMASQSCVECK